MYENLRPRDMDERNETEQRFHDYLSGEPGFDSGQFTEEANSNPALKRVLRNLSALPNVETVPDKDRMIFIVKTRLAARRKRQMVRIWSRVAAVVVLFIAAGTFISREPQTLEPAVLSYSASPEDQEVKLVLESGEALSVSQIDSLQKIGEGETDVRLTDQGQIAYTHKPDTGRQIVYHTLQVPRKKWFRLLLADNTEVWLNAETEIKYPVSFPGNERKVFVSGEAFFKVAKESERPFVVVADHIEVEVLGTWFNVNTYMDEGALTTTLVKGSVRVRDTVSGHMSILAPNQQAAVGKDGISVHAVDASQVAGWISGLFLYSDMTLDAFCKYLERRYDVQVRFDDPTLRHYLLTGVVKQQHSFAEVCKYIEETTRVRFEVNDRNVTVCRAK